MTYHFPVNISLIFQYSCSKVQKQPFTLFRKILVVFKNFTKFTRKHRCRSILLISLEWLFNKVEGLRPANLLKKKLQHRYFHIFTKHLRRLLLKVICENLHLTFINQLIILESPIARPPSPILNTDTSSVRLWS